ncbi:MAG: glycosyl transferase family 2 [Wenzhouxiangella sp.]|nr:MAG: glycosyl transferase family 2 [Wenzhouxiangella sp.]
MDKHQLTVIVPVGASESAWPALVRQIPADWPIVMSATTRCPPDLRQRMLWHRGLPGRGRQLNAGAALAATRWLWFIHADSELGPDVCAAMTAWCAGKQRGLAYLDLAFQNDGPWLTRLNAAGANLRSRWFGLPYGDQGLCVSKPEFDRLGGFREDLARGEDLDFVVRARSAGLPASRVPGVIRTSARRYRTQGWLRTTWQHQINARRLIRNARGQRIDTAA